jgi:hypothetical protein
MTSFDRHGLKTSILLLILWAAPDSMAKAKSASEPSGGALQVVCSLEQPIVAPAGKVTAGVLVDAPKSADVRYLWKATAGGFAAKPGSPELVKESTEATVEWNPHGAALGVYTLSVTVIDAKGASGVCSVEAQVSEEQEHRSASNAVELGSEAARALLIKGRTERKGYGLYSYILARRPMDAGGNDRLKEVLKDYLKLEDVNLEKAFKLSELNITYVPVTGRSPANPPDADWILKNYDYSEGSLLLKELKQEGDGPYIVSSIQPLEGADKPPDSYIVQDLSTVPVSIIPLWMKQFRSQTTQQRVWEKKTIGNMALKMRTAIAIAAEGLPMVQKAVGAMITLTSEQ